MDGAGGGDEAGAGKIDPPRDLHARHDFGRPRAGSHACSLADGSTFAACLVPAILRRPGRTLAWPLAPAESSGERVEDRRTQ